MEEFTRARAEQELTWYFGTNAQSTAQGDFGLKSTLGYQLEAVQQERIGTERTWTDGSKADEQMARSAAAAAQCGRVERALVAINDDQRTVLRYAFAHKDLRPGLSRVTCLTGPARLEAERQIAERDNGRRASESDVLQVILEARPQGTQWLEMAKAAASILTARALDAYRVERAKEPRQKRSWVQW